MSMQMDLDEQVMEDLVTSHGLHVLHIMRYGPPASQFAWRDKWADARVPGDVREFMTWHVSQEENKSLPYWHLHLYWNVRDMVDMSRWGDVPLRYGVMWFIPRDRGETISGAANEAAKLYLIHTGRMAAAVWINAELVTKRPFVDTGYGKLEVITGQGWVPERYIVVGVARSDWDAKFVGGRYE
jgi:hypothetical protein